MITQEQAEGGAGTVLIVDDDVAIRRVLRSTLCGAGFNVVEAARGEEAVSLVKANRFDAVLLDINMPGMDGVVACRYLRHGTPDLPILMLTVRGSDDDKVLALDSGADDYITKPFRAREMLARVRSAVRRRQVRMLDETAPIRNGEIELDVLKHLVTKLGKPVHLTPKEFDLLHYMMIHTGELIPHARLLKAVWGPEYGNELEYLRTFVRNLRKKLEDDPGNPRYLLTDAYLGYRLNDHGNGF
jgi:two-component system KDP operon response regulator KdpE